ncbi:MAG: Molybdopterin molybdenumtransferase [Acidimicrobiales bacterium AG-410-I20]|nr:MAG: Molybdopterin molybdenumtransferase [Acidimicrobiales bacterium AG-410-I20]
MISLKDAQEYVLQHCRVGSPEIRSSQSSLGLVLAEEVSTNENVPPFDNTAMDGFAVRSEDTLGAPQQLEIVGTIPAGSTPDFSVSSGQAARIMTGAPLPEGADAVVMVELTKVEEDYVTVQKTVPQGNHIRRAGEDLKSGQVVFEKGTRLTPTHLGVLASIACLEVSVFPPLKIGVMSTGDELIEGETPLQPGQIRDSNRHSLLALLHDLGLEGVDLGLIPDSEEDIEATIRSACFGEDSCDAVISSGGVSMGDFDYVKVVLDRLGDMQWMQVAIKPAKPLAFGLVGDTPVFGLPGNPVSSMVSFELFVLPALKKMMGESEIWAPQIRAIADSPLSRRPDGKTHFARVQASIEDGMYRVKFSGGQGSHQLSAMADSNALAVVPDGDGIDEGEFVEIILLHQLTRRLNAS